MSEPRVLILGSSGMAGHLMVQYLRESGGYDVRDVGPRRSVFAGTILCDLMNRDAVIEVMRSERPDFVVNCVGMLVKASEERKKEAIWINAFLPHLLAEVCAEFGGKLIHISTDCVFSGANGPYEANDQYDGQDFYGRTKGLGEIRDGDSLTVRTSIVGPELRADGTGLFDWFMRQRGAVNGFKNAFWSGVTTLQLAKTLERVMSGRRELRGVVQYSVEGGISKCEFLRLTKEIFGTPVDIVPAEDPRLDKRLVLSAQMKDFAPAGYALQLAELKEWIDSRPLFYRNPGEYS